MSPTLDPRTEVPEVPTPSAKSASPKRFMLVWFAIPIIVVLVLAFLK